MRCLLGVKGFSQFVNLPAEVRIGSMKALAMLIPTLRPVAGMNLQMSELLL